ncbi:MAG: hypothetical protein ACI87H_001414, partial [Gammaproteobacteria bacterium]
TINASNSGGTINLTETSGNLMINGAIMNSGGTTSLTSSNGNITGAGVVTAGTLMLSAQTGIGPITTTVNSLNINNATGNVTINNTAAATLNISGSNGGVGTINVIEASGSILVNAALSHATGDINLSAASGGISGAALISAATLGLTANSGIAVNTAVGTLTFTNASNGSVQVTNTIGTTFNVSGTNSSGGNITVTETTGVASVNGVLDSNDGAITLIADSMTAGAAINPGAGLLTLRSFNPAANVNTTDYNTLLGQVVTATGGLTLGSSAHSGSITVGSVIDLSVLDISGVFQILAASGNIIVNSNLTNVENIGLQTGSGTIHIGPGITIDSTAGNISLASGGALQGNGNITLNATTGLLLSNELSSTGSITIDVDTLNIQNNLTSGGDIVLTSKNPILIDQPVTFDAGGQITLAEIDARGSVTLNGNGINLGNFVLINTSSILTIDAGTGSLMVNGNLSAPASIAINATEFDLLAGMTITAAGPVTISDNGNGIGIGTTLTSAMDIGTAEISAISASQLIFASSSIKLPGNLSLTGYTVPVVFDTGNFDITGTTSISLGGNLSFADSVVTVSGGLTLTTGGSFSMEGIINATNTVNINPGQGLTMGPLAEIHTTDDAININSTGGNVLLGLLDADTANVAIQATGGDILNNNGVFANVALSNTNVKAGNVSLSATDRIGTSSTDAITVDIDIDGSINLTFGADTAYINNLRGSRIVNNSAGEVAVGLIFSNQIIGIGHSVGAEASNRDYSLSKVFFGQTGAAENLISILGSDFQISFDNDSEDDVASSIIPSVPVMIKTVDGWQFVAPSRNQNTETLRQNREKGVKFIDWL